MFTALSSSLAKSFPQIDNNNTNCLFMFFFVTDYPANGGRWCFSGRQNNTLVNVKRIHALLNHIQHNTCGTVCASCRNNITSSAYFPLLPIKTVRQLPVFHYAKSWVAEYLLDQLYFIALCTPVLKSWLYIRSQ